MSRLLLPEVSSAATWTSREAGGSAAAKLLRASSRSGCRNLVGSSQTLRQWEFIGQSLQCGSIPAFSTGRKTAGLRCVASVEGGDAGVRRVRAPASSNAARAVSARDATAPLPFARVAESTLEAPRVPPPSSAPSGGFPGGPLLWIGVGVGVTLIFSTLTKSKKEEPSGSSFSRPAASSATFDTTTTNAPSRGNEPDYRQSQPSKRSSAFSDVGLEQQQQGAFAGATTQVMDPPRRTTNGQAAVGGLTMEMLEKMLNEPQIQKMLMQYLPENVRDPQTLKWVLQNPIYREQLEDALQNMSRGGGAWDPRVMETFSKLDLNSAEMKKQFQQIGMTPEQMVTTVMSDPKMAEALQNPKFQAAILDCAQNPMNMLKYQNDSEIMVVFDKMQKLFPSLGV